MRYAERKIGKSVVLTRAQVTPGHRPRYGNAVDNPNDAGPLEPKILEPWFPFPLLLPFRSGYSTRVKWGSGVRFRYVRQSRAVRAGSGHRRSEGFEISPLPIGQDFAFKRSRISISNFWSVVGPAGSASGFFQSLFMPFTTRKMQKATMMKSRIVLRNEP